MPLWQGGPLTIDRPIFVRVADVPALMMRFTDPANDSFPRVIHVSPAGEAPLPILEFLYELDDKTVPFWSPTPPREDVRAAARRKRPDPLFELARRTPSLDRAREYRIAKAVDVAYRPLINSARDVITALHACNAAGLRRAAEALEVAAEGLLEGGAMRCNPLTKSWAEYLQVFSEEVVVGLDQGTTFVHGTPSTSRKSWWKGRPEAHARCESAIRGLALLAPLVATPAGAKLMAWLSALRSHFTAMSPPIGGTPASAFEQASAWYVACAIRHLEQGQSGWALLFLHRGVEWLMMTKLAQANILDFTRPGTEYKEPHASQAGSAQVNYMSSLRLLSPAKGFFDSYTTLHDWRNLLPYTHHMTIAEQSVAQALIGEVLGSLHAFAQSSEWLNATKAFSAPPPLELEDLLDPDGALRRATVAA